MGKTTSKPGLQSTVAITPWWKRTWFISLVLLGLTLAAYLPAWHSGFVWDDDDYVTQNRTLNDLRGLGRIWFEPSATPQYYPLVFTTFWLEHHLWGLDPTGYHVVNVFLNVLAAVLLVRVLARLQVPGAWLAGAIFAVHPVNVESVAWVTERKNVLSAVFYFAAALAYLRFAAGERLSAANGNGREGRGKKPAVSPAGPPRRFWYVAAMLLFAGALLSKTVTASLPAALLLVFWWQRGRIGLREVVPLLPFFAVGVGLSIHTSWLETHQVGASGAEWALSFVDRCLIAGRDLWFYAGKLVWPARLTFIYPRWEINPAVWWQWLYPLAALVVVAVLWCGRKRMGRGPLVAVLFFAGTLFPALGFVNVYPMRFSFVADHFQYLAGVGLIVLMAAGLVRIPAKILCCLPLVLGILTWRQAHIYRDPETLWRDTLAKNSTCWLAHNNLGLILRKQGNPAEAEAHYRAALALKPDYADAWNNLGQTAFEQGRTAEAETYYQKALAIQPGLHTAMVNLGCVWLTQGHLDQAITVFRKSLEFDPNSPEILNDLGSALASRQQYAEAITNFEAALRLNAGQISAHINLANTLARLGRYDEAVGQFQEALKIAPDNEKARNDLARVQALRLNPNPEPAGQPLPGPRFEPESTGLKQP